jgi:MutS domain V
MNSVNNGLISDIELDNKVIPAIDHTITLYGKSKLRELFNIIYFGENNLLRRRQIIESMVKNPKRIKKIIIELKKIHKHEQNVSWLFTDIGKEYKDLYFKKEYFNSQDLLSTSNFLKIYMPSFIFLVYIIIYIFLRYYGIKIDLKQYISNIYESYRAFISGILFFFTYNINMISFLANMLATLYVLWQAYLVFNSIDTSITHYHKCHDFKNIMFNVQSILKSCQKIYKLDKFMVHEKKLLRQNLKLVKSSFKDVNSLGYCLLLKRNYFQYESQFNAILHYIGTLDAFINISNLVTHHGFTFPQFDFHKNGPYIQAYGLWCPFNPLFQQVKNDCFLGNPHSLILTGPNTSGKTTYIRNVMLSIFLSQTIGVTCCDHLVFTPFDHLFTYLDIPNISRQKESLFEAELLRCIEYCQILESIDPDKYAFTVCDELLTATNPPEGISCSFAICEYMSQFSNSLNIITTHFMELTHLEELYPQKFKNMKFYVLRNEDGTFYKPYKIKEGKSNQHIAVELLKQKGYHNFIVDRALDKLKTIK